MASLLESFVINQSWAILDPQGHCPIHLVSSFAFDPDSGFRGHGSETHPAPSPSVSRMQSDLSLRAGRTQNPLTTVAQSWGPASHPLLFGQEKAKMYCENLSKPLNVEIGE